MLSHDKTSGIENLLMFSRDVIIKLKFICKREITTTEGSRQLLRLQSSKTSKKKNGEFNTIQ